MLRSGDERARDAAAGIFDQRQPPRASPRRGLARAQPGEEDAKGLKRPVNTLTEALDSGIHRAPDDRPGSTTLQSAQELMSFAAQHLPHVQVEALRDWIDGYDFTEIATRQSMPSAKDAERTIRAAIARLRRHFSG